MGQEKAEGKCGEFQRFTIRNPFVAFLSYRLYFMLPNWVNGRQEVGLFYWRNRQIIDKLITK